MPMNLLNEPQNETETVYGVIEQDNELLIASDGFPISV